MKDFFHSTGFKVLLGVIFILFGVLLYTASAGGSIFSDALGFLTTPMQKVSTVITNNAAVTANNVLQTKEDLEAEDSHYPCLRNLDTDILAFPQLIQKINNILSPYG